MRGALGGALAGHLPAARCAVRRAHRGPREGNPEMLGAVGVTPPQRGSLQQVSGCLYHHLVVRHGAPTSGRLLLVMRGAHGSRFVR